MNPAKVILVHLRLPRRSNPKERRDDPFWEFGSFGCTGCHKRNLMNTKRLHELWGHRLGFAQGGHLGFRLVYLSPPITKVVKHIRNGEVLWEPISMPFRYDKAPLIIDEYGNTDFPGFKKEILNVGRDSWRARFSSRFRSRRKPLPGDLATLMAETYDRFVEQAEESWFATDYVGTLPYAPPLVDRERKKTYDKLVNFTRRPE